MKQDFVTIWKQLANEKRNSSLFHTQYCILRAIVAKGEDKIAIAKHLLRKAQPPVTRPTKLASGRSPFDTTIANLRAYRWGGSHKTILGVPALDLLTEEEYELYNKIAKAICDGGLVRHYSYFFTRQDLGFDEYQLVQTAHVALELGNKLTEDQKKDLHFTCCGVKNIEELEEVEKVLQTMRLPYEVFREPDIGNQKTAIGVYPVEEHKRGLLRNYNLLRFDRPKMVDLIAQGELEEVM